MGNRFKKIIICALSLVIFCTFIEWHQDHDANAKTNDVCCVQCCPSHHLAPVSQNNSVLRKSDLTFPQYLEVSQVYLEFYPHSIDRPPIA